MNHNNINKSGCITLATKSIDKTAAKLGYGLKKSTTIKVWSIKNILFIAILMIELMNLIQPASTMAIQRHHHQKKNSLEFLLNNHDPNVGYHLVKHRKKHSINESDSDLDSDAWVNPCGGNWIKDASRNSISMEGRKAAWRNLRKSIKHEKSRQAHLNYALKDNLKELKCHHESYKFLKVVNPKIHKIALRSWHKNAQVYIGSFAYLYKIQRKLDHKKSTSYESELTAELRNLLGSAMNVLCNIEEAINITRLHPNIKIYSRAEMNSTLKLASVNEIDEFDMKFLKARYYKLLVGMIGSLHQKLYEIKYCGDNDASTSSNSATIESDETNFTSLLNIDSSKDSSGYRSTSHYLRDRRNEKKCKEIRQNRSFNKRRNQQNDSFKSKTNPCT